MSRNRDSSLLRSKCGSTQDVLLQRSNFLMACDLDDARPNPGVCYAFLDFSDKYRGNVFDAATRCLDADLWLKVVRDIPVDTGSHNNIDPGFGGGLSNEGGVTTNIRRSHVDNGVDSYSLGSTKILHALLEYFGTVVKPGIPSGPTGAGSENVFVHKRKPKAILRKPTGRRWNHQYPSCAQ